MDGQWYEVTTRPSPRPSRWYLSTIVASRAAGTSPAAHATATCRGALTRVTLERCHFYLFGSLSISRHRRCCRALPLEQGLVQPRERRAGARKLSGWPKRCKSARVFPWESSNKGLQPAQFLGQLGVFSPISGRLRVLDVLPRLHHLQESTGYRTVPAIMTRYDLSCCWHGPL